MMGAYLTANQKMDGLVQLAETLKMDGGEAALSLLRKSILTTTPLVGFPKVVFLIVNPLKLDSNPFGPGY